MHEFETNVGARAVVQVNYSQDDYDGVEKVCCVSVTEWLNGEGFDIHVDSLDTTAAFAVSKKDFDAIEHALAKLELLKQIEGE